MPKKPPFNLCPFLTLSVRNGPRVSFGTDVLCIADRYRMKEIF